jgi:nucleotidyltransferase AbiEii toxin of type IV toxin-antitoxin system
VTADIPYWARLFRIAYSLIRQVNSEQIIINSWSFGGGTAMMLQIDHRESDDIDIFLPDAQFLAFLDPKLRDFEFEITPSDYTGDGAGFIKLAFDGIGEIDFIVGHALTATPTTKRWIETEDIDLETTSEIIAKKIHYRGASIKPRDIFDIAAAAKHDRDPIVSALKAYKGDVTRTLLAIDRLNPDFVSATIAELAIKDQFKPIADTAINDAKELLRLV